MEYRILGPLQVLSSGRQVHVTGLRSQRILAMLLINSNRVVTIDRLVDAAWNGDPPSTARRQVQNRVATLRALLLPSRAILLTHTAGYRLVVCPDELDADVFDHLTSSAAVDGDLASRTAAFRRALALWRGPALDGLASAMLAPAAQVLEEKRLAALGDYIDLQLEAASYSEAIPELARLKAEHPQRERFLGQWMLAVSAVGRRTEALDAYHEFRTRNIEQRGLDPGQELHRTYLSLLREESHSGAAPAPAPAPAPASHDTASRAGLVPVPRELPALDPHFTGRGAELAALTRLVAENSLGTRATALVTAISGSAGTGKTALAVQWAHQMAGRFRDGQLYVNLRGYDPGDPAPATSVLAAFLRSLGMADRDIPDDCDERAARFRSLLAGRRVLVVLDNAADAEHVRPLLPGAPGCLTVITSRNPLAGLIVRNGAERIDLGPLSADGAVELLRSLVGGRVDAEADAVALAVRLCGRLPLALRIFAERAAGRPALPLTALTGELADSQRRLDLLDAGGDSHTSVRAVLSWSARQLAPGSARVFRLCGLHPGAELDAHAVAALAGAGPDDVIGPLDELTRTSLVQVSERGHYVMHDLLRDYARELAISGLGEADRHAALTRLHEHYLATAAAAMDSLYPAEQARRRRISQNTASSPAFGSPEAARHWLDDKRATLLTMVAHAAREDWPGCAPKLALTLHRHLTTGGYYHEALAIFGTALDAARRTGDDAAEAWLLNYIGATNSHLGRLHEAAEIHEHALTLFRKADDRMGEADVLCSLGAYDVCQGRHQEAGDRYRAAAALAKAADDWRGEQRALTDLSVIDLQRGRYGQASDRLREALSLTRRLGHRHLEAHTLTLLGQVELRWGRYQQAAEHLEQALLLHRTLGNRKIEADTLAGLGLLSSRQGRHRQAIGQLRQSLALCREAGDLMIEQQALINLGEVFLACGRPARARTWYDKALHLAGQVGDRYEEARACAGLAATADSLNDHAVGRRYWRQAQLIFTELGAPEAEQIYGGWHIHQNRLR